MTSFPIDFLNFDFLHGFQLLLDLAIKSVIVMLAAWALAKMLRNASAAARHWVWSLAVAGLLALPALSLALPGWQLGWLPALMQNAASMPDAVTPSTIAEPATTVVSETPSAPVSITLRFEIDASDAPPVKAPDNSWSGAIPSFVRSLNWGMAALIFWLAGAALVLARLLAGTVKVWRLAKLANRVTESGWLALAGNLATRLRLRGNVELRKSAEVRLPMTWGAWRSVVMLPADADGWTPECRNIVLLHELAHVKRRDCLTQNLAQLACALYWFNPLVWLASKQLHVERELACDDQVLEVGTKASDYAGHLVEIARSFQADSTLSPVTVGMACSQLESRVRAILDPGVRRRGLNRLSAAVIGLGAIGLVLALAVAQPWSKTNASQAVNRLVGVSLFGITADPSQTPNVENQTPAALPSEKNAPQAEPRENVEQAAQETAEADSDDDPQDGQAKAQSSELTAEQLIQMKIAGVTPEFIAEMRKQGFDNLSIRDLTQLGIHGVNSEFIQQARAWGGDRVSVRDIVQLKISGVTPEYFAAMKRAGFNDLSARQLSELSIHGVTPDFIEAMRRNGYDKLTANQL
ncbi:MAG TPA: M56 family metallopeptidase, partial [Blastocatellia bacterium]|nr:M56 family metallopeptidase [Blastocatellia bacterium]